MNQNNNAKVYLIPVPLAEGDLNTVLPKYNLDRIKEIHYFVVENIRSARRFLKQVDRNIVIDDLTFYELNKRTDLNKVDSYLKPLEEGQDMGVISEAGCPAVADPGAVFVAKAQRKGFGIVPLVGPSSILLSLMGSGFNGQSFVFHGYLPIDDQQRKRALQRLESDAIKLHQTQIFIETPYRNNKLIDEICAVLRSDTKLCIASNLTSPDQFLKTKSIGEWQKSKPELHKIPTIYLIGK